jgi:hypothetical protein
VEQLFEPRELLAVGEDDLRDVGPLRRPVALEQRRRDPRVLFDQLMNDLVAGDRRGAVAREGL